MITCIESVDDEMIIMDDESHGDGGVNLNTILVNNGSAAADELEPQQHSPQNSLTTVLIDETEKPPIHKSIRRIVADGDADACPSPPPSQNTSSSTASISSSSASASATVKFDKVIIRNYNDDYCGDDPHSYTTSGGTTVAGSFSSSEEQHVPQQIEMSVEAYESCRDGKRRSKEHQMHMEVLGQHDTANLRGHQISFSVRDEVERAQRQRIKNLSQPRKQRRQMVDKIVKTANRGFRQMVKWN